MFSKENKNIKSKINSFIQNLLFIIIILSIIQIILESLSFIILVNKNLRVIFILSGAIFDIIFSIEFIIKSLINLKNRKFREYFLYRNGWIDFLASIPVLIFSTIPAIIEIYTVQSIFRMRIFKLFYLLRSVKIIRTSRIIRILRILKLVGKIENLNSIMLQKNINFISIISTNSILISFLIIKILFPLDYDKILEKHKIEYSKKLELVIVETKTLVEDISTNILKEYMKNNTKNNIKNNSNKNYELINFTNENLMLNYFKKVFSNDSMLISLKYKNSELVRNYNSKYVNEYFDNNSIYKFDINNYTFEIVLFELIKYKNIENLTILLIVLLNILTIVFFFSKRFSITISDPIYLLYKGIKDPSYFLMIKIPKKYEEEEIFQFVKFYNEKYLPAKYKLYIKNKDKLSEKKESSIKLDDLDKLV